mmetsp:Transcript_20847/g.32165  ORF Transcript_20847/g.32165 Transcript_20847/m.32165 type:complete len:118 (-) Transcript_20847:541-894(-)|eukprot:CAMPEP_0170484370 /NCGR_PEP_ID=MMETSP0208-20121228/3849_1 /TAXON_ID=197538 /ORGANISM="Strombidium inclinatum, Strain S3" /LENGTH=117 /DNA_ID=CAMNT_0010757687 /DNA_START=1752 /DNA_END=2105 /DNA_ORIENTATION=-
MSLVKSEDPSGVALDANQQEPNLVEFSQPEEQVPGEELKIPEEDPQESKRSGQKVKWPSFQNNPRNHDKEVVPSRDIMWPSKGQQPEAQQTGKFSEEEVPSPHDDLEEFERNYMDVF